MKFTICLVLLAGSALLARCDPLQCDADTAQEVRIAAGEKIKEALVSENYPNNYPNNTCQRWNIMAEENQCVIFSTGKIYFTTEEEYDWVTFTDVATGRQDWITGEYVRLSPHEYISETNNVVVEFTSDDIVTKKGFKLDLKSFPCLQGTVTKTYKGSEYTLIAKMQKFETSRQECMDLGGDLAVITSMQEHNFIGRMIVDAADSVYASNVKNTWIGLYKTWENRNLRWVDGTPFEINDQSWAPWGSGQPDEYGSGAVYLLPGSFRFADRDFWNEYWALCEKSVD